MNNVMRTIHQLCKSSHIQLMATYLLGVDNMVADHLSRMWPHHEWKLAPAMFCRLDQCWGPHTIDRTASASNSQLPRFNSWLLEAKRMLLQYTCTALSAVILSTLMWCCLLGSHQPAEVRVGELNVAPRDAPQPVREALVLSRMLHSRRFAKRLFHVNRPWHQSSRSRIVAADSGMRLFQFALQAMLWYIAQEELGWQDGLGQGHSLANHCG